MSGGDVSLAGTCCLFLDVGDSGGDTSVAQGSDDPGGADDASLW